MAFILFVTFFAALVIIGGLKRISKVAEKIVNDAINKQNNPRPIRNEQQPANRTITFNSTSTPPRKPMPNSNAKPNSFNNNRPPRMSVEERLEKIGINLYKLGCKDREKLKYALVGAIITLENFYRDFNPDKIFKFSEEWVEKIMEKFEEKPVVKEEPNPITPPVRPAPPVNNVPFKIITSEEKSDDQKLISNHIDSSMKIPTKEDIDNVKETVKADEGNTTVPPVVFAEPKKIEDLIGSNAIPTELPDNDNSKAVNILADEQEGETPVVIDADNNEQLNEVSEDDDMEEEINQMYLDRVDSESMDEQESKWDLESKFMSQCNDNNPKIEPIRSKASSMRKIYRDE